MLDAASIVVALVHAAYLAFSKRLANSSSWRATVTPLASIMRSGFLVSAPLLGGIVGTLGVVCMALLPVLACAVLQYAGEGQLTREPQLPVVASLGSKGFLSARIVLDDDALAKVLPLCAAGTVATCGNVGRPLCLISKIALRMKAWIYYAPI